MEQRITAYRRCGITLSHYQQAAELKVIRAEMSEYGAIHSHVLQDVLARLDKTYQAFFRRLKGGGKAGFPRYKPAARYTSFTYKEYGNGATLDNGYLVLSKIGRVAVRWSRLIEGTIKTVTISHEIDGWYVSSSCSDVPTQLLPATGQETGIDLGLEAFATLADGTRIENPRQYRQAERRLKTAQRRVSRRKRGSTRRHKAVRLLAKPISQCGASGRTFTTKRRSCWCASTTPSIMKTCRRSTCSGITISPRASAMRAGVRF